MYDSTPSGATPLNRDYENHHVREIHREPMHVPLAAYGSRDEARSGDRYASPNLRLLDGRWIFRVFDRPVDVPSDFAADDFDASGWGSIVVPGTWETQGFGTPIYTNMKYPFGPDEPERSHLIDPLASPAPGGAMERERNDYDGAVLAPPRVPSLNPTGCNLTDFTVDPQWAAKEVYISFEGVESAFFIWLNGVCIGYGQDSKLSSEFRLTDLIRPGSNRLGVQVMRWSDGSYLEDQDYWHVSGIHRPVVLYAKPSLHIRDYRIRTLVDLSSGDAELEVACRVTELDEFGSCRVRVELEDEAGDRIAAGESSVSIETPMYGAAKPRPERGAATGVMSVRSPKLWSDESPTLYRAILTLMDPDGSPIDFESARVGFRDVRIGDDGVIRLNGKRLIVRGTNRHEHDPRTGRLGSVDRMREEILAMKRLNFNAVRTSHYPNDPRWYDLCDELGIIVVDEANLETHGLGAQLSCDPSWSAAYLERATRMVLRDKNHPCILFWSLGNESGVGPNHAAMAAWIRSYDPTRLVQYESGDPGPDVTDLRVPMYPNTDWVTEAMSDPTDRRPMVMCEYAYAKSNSNGGVAKYWNLVHRFPRFQGGFVWDWSDKALPVYGRDGVVGWGYGGDFGESVVNEQSLDMCLNGVVQPDLSPHPGALEIKQLQAPLRFHSDAPGLAAGTLSVTNDYHSTDLSHLVLSWSLLRNGSTVGAGRVEPPSVAPGATSTVGIPWIDAIPQDLAITDAVWLVNVDACLASETIYAPAGHEIAAAQFDVCGIVAARVGQARGSVPARPVASAAPPTSAPVRFAITDDGDRPRCRRRLVRERLVSGRTRPPAATRGRRGGFGRLRRARRCGASRVPARRAGPIHPIDRLPPGAVGLAHRR